MGFGLRIYGGMGVSNFRLCGFRGFRVLGFTVSWGLGF